MSEPFTREPGYQYFVTDAEKRTAEPKLPTDEYWWENSQKWRAVAEDSTDFLPGFYRRRIAATEAGKPERDTRLCTGYAKGSIECTCCQCAIPDGEAFHWQVCEPESIWCGTCHKRAQGQRAAWKRDDAQRNLETLARVVSTSTSDYFSASDEFDNGWDEIHTIDQSVVKKRADARKRLESAVAELLFKTEDLIVSKP